MAYSKQSMEKPKRVENKDKTKTANEIVLKYIKGFENNGTSFSHLLPFHSSTRQQQRFQTLLKGIKKVSF